MAPEIKKGLKDVYLDTTESSFIDGQEGKLLYRGYNIHELAEKSTFEETAYLLLYGSLPNKRQLSDFDAVLRANRIIPDEIIQVLDLVKSSHPMDALRTGVSALAAFDPDVKDNSTEATIPQSGPPHCNGPNHSRRPSPAKAGVGACGAGPGTEPRRKLPENGLRRGARARDRRFIGRGLHPPR